MKIDKDLNKSTKQKDSYKLYVSMEHTYSNIESPRRHFGESSQLTNWILDSGATFHRTLEI